MLTRRDFIKAASASSVLGFTKPVKALASRYQDSAGFFGVHPFIENNPDAVFIMRTNVDVKTNAEAMKQAGLDFGRGVFVPKSEQEGGVPLTHRVAIKPNLTWSGTGSTAYTLEYGMGIVSDPWFVEGIIESMKDLGLSGSQFYMREVNSPGDFGPRGFYDVAERTGGDLRDMSAKVGDIDENDLVWVDVPEGIWFRKIPYLWPINAPDTWLLNISKLKAHAMGLTLSAKNLQGSVAHNYQVHCNDYGRLMEMSRDHMNLDAFDIIKENYNRHVADGIPRWERPGTGSAGGIGQETWSTRCIDNNIAATAGLHIIEGIYSRDGNGFFNGPNPEGNDDNDKGDARDYMSNIIIFGKNPIYTDIIGHWLGGHEPGNFGLFHLAIERGLSTVLDPGRIPVYEWSQDGSAVLTPLDDFERTSLKTLYLRRDFDGQYEPYWHLVNEPYDYGPETSVEKPDKPQAIVLGQNYPNPFNPYTSIEYKLPSNGNVRIEIYNSAGQLVDVLVNGYRRAGSHMAVWNTNNHPSGTYFYRLRFGGFSETKKMVLLK